MVVLTLKPRRCRSLEGDSLDLILFAFGAQS